VGDPDGRPAGAPAPAQGSGLTAQEQGAVLRFRLLQSRLRAQERVLPGAVVEEAPGQCRQAAQQHRGGGCATGTPPALAPSATCWGSAHATSSRSRSRTPPRPDTRRRRSRLPCSGLRPELPGQPRHHGGAHPEAFINAHNFGSPEELADHVLKVEDDLYLRCLSATRFAGNKLPDDADWGVVADRLERIFSQRVEPASARGLPAGMSSP